MPLQKTVTAFQKRADGKCVLTFTDGTFEFDGFSDMVEWSRRLETDNVMLMLIVSYFLARSADASNPQPVIGTFTLDAASANVFRKQ